MLLSCNNINKSFGIDVVLENISFNIDEKEKVAIVGVNGAGKTTLFKIITEQMSQDSGEIIFPKEYKIGYLSQDLQLNENNTIYAEMLNVFEHIIKLEEKIRDVENEMSFLSGEDLELCMQKYSRLTQEFDESNGYEYKSRIRGVIKGLGFADEESEQIIKTLSGGQKTRVSLAKLLLSQPDLLLLDEPTNHLDIESIQWLEDFLKAYTKGIIIISHDRYFLDKIVTKVVEIENGKAYTYNGNYSFFAHQKEVDREISLKHYINQQKEIKRQEEVIRQLKSYNREKSIKRAESREKQLEKLVRVERPENLPDNIRISLSPKRESGNDVLFVRDISKSFDEQMIFKNITFDIKKGEKTALIGANGIGKSTILKIILDRLEADTGEIKLGTNVIIGYYDQEHEDIDYSKTIFEEISDSYPKLTTLEIRNALAAFIFTGDDVFKPISALSGGERGRVALAKIMLSNSNFLILDEPTNHLDIFSKEILEEAIRKYSGTVLYISHDRYFINNTAQKIIELTYDKASVFLGNYDYYLEKKAELDFEAEELIKQTKSNTEKDKWIKKKESVSDERKIKNQLKRTEISIEETEAQLKDLEKQLELEDVYTDPEKANSIYEKKVELENSLYELYERWETLTEGS